MPKGYSELNDQIEALNANSRSAARGLDGVVVLIDVPYISTVDKVQEQCASELKSKHGYNWLDKNDVEILFSGKVLPSNKIVGEVSFQKEATAFFRIKPQYSNDRLLKFAKDAAETGAFHFQFFDEKQFQAFNGIAAEQKIRGQLAGRVRVVHINFKLFANILTQPTLPPLFAARTLLLTLSVTNPFGLASDLSVTKETIPFISDTLKENNCALQHLNLSNINVGYDGTKTLGEALKINKSCTSVTLDECVVTLFIAPILGQALANNRSLTALKIKTNGSLVTHPRLSTILRRNQMLQTNWCLVAVTLAFLRSNREHSFCTSLTAKLDGDRIKNGLEKLRQQNQDETAKPSLASLPALIQILALQQGEENAAFDYPILNHNLFLCTAYAHTIHGLRFQRPTAIQNIQTFDIKDDRSFLLLANKTRESMALWRKASEAQKQATPSQHTVVKNQILFFINHLMLLGAANHRPFTLISLLVLQNNVLQLDIVASTGLAQSHLSLFITQSLKDSGITVPEDPATLKTYQDHLRIHYSAHKQSLQKYDAEFTTVLGQKFSSNESADNRIFIPS